MAKKQFSEKTHYNVPPKRILGAAISLVIFFLFLTSVIGLAQKYFTLRTRNSELNNSQEELIAKEKDLSTTNNYLSTPEGTEQSLRERYNYIKPGEEMIVITPDTATPPPPPPKTGIAHIWDELLRGVGLRSDPSSDPQE
jgi:cell division protein FtsB